MNFQNKTNKIGTKSEGKKSLRATVIFFIGNAQIEVNKREMKGKKLNQRQIRHNHHTYTV